MPSLHMTDVVVSRLQQPGTYWDETTPGFGVRVGKNRKTWIVMRGQIRQRVRIGHYLPLDRLQTLFRCPKCGNRAITVAFEVPNQPKAEAAE